MSAYDLLLSSLPPHKRPKTEEEGTAGAEHWREEREGEEVEGEEEGEEGDEEGSESDSEGAPDPEGPGEWV